MNIKYDINVSNTTVVNHLRKLIDQTYKLLPIREENSDWQKPLGSLLLELAGVSHLLIDYEGTLWCLVCKLEGLHSLTDDKDFYLYRKTIFECIALLSEVITLCKD